jgi:hypothetical protein
MVAFSMASQVVSRRRRCWGSMAVASRGEMPKKVASKPVMSVRNPPWRV